MTIGGNGVDSFLPNLFLDSLTVAFLYALHLVIADSVQLVVSDGGSLCVELIQTNGLVSVL